MEIENNLKVWRAKKEVTQGELAERVGVTRQTIHTTETGRYNPSLELAFKLAEYFDCRIEDIFTPVESES